jgi:hypothetical protein
MPSIIPQKMRLRRFQTDEWFLKKDGATSYLSFVPFKKNIN